MAYTPTVHTGTSAELSATQIAGSLVTGGGLSGTAIADALSLMNLDGAAYGLTTTWPTTAISIAKEVYIADGDQAYMRLLLDREPMNRVVDTDGGPKRYWKERDVMPEIDTSAGSSADQVTTTIAVNHSKMWTVGNICRGFSPSFQAWVTAKDDVASTITLSFGNNPPATAITVNTVLRKMGSTSREWQYPHTSGRTQEVQKENTYVFPQDWLAISNRAEASRLVIGFPFGGTKWDGEMHLLEQEHNTGNEKIIWWGMSDLDVTGQNSVGFTEGLYERCTTHVWDAGGAVATEDDIEQMLFDFFAEDTGDVNGDVKIFHGGYLQQTLSTFPMKRFQEVNRDEDEYGMSVTTFRCSNGQRVKLVYHPLFMRYGFPDLAMGVRMDPDAVSLVWHRSCPDTHRVDAILPLGLEGKMSGFRSGFTTEVKDEKRHLLKITGLGRPTFPVT